MRQISGLVRRKPDSWAWKTFVLEEVQDGIQNSSSCLLTVTMHQLNQHKGWCIFFTFETMIRYLCSCWRIKKILFLGCLHPKDKLFPRMYMTNMTFSIFSTCKTTVYITSPSVLSKSLKMVNFLCIYLYFFIFTKGLNADFCKW